MFTNDWLSVEAQTTLTELARSVSGVEGLIVEIGAWEGRSTVALANTINPRVLHTCDTWEGSPSDESGSLASLRDVYSVWLENVHQLTAGNVAAHRMGWREYVPTITGPVAFCFIDAEHTYDEVHDNIVAVLPLLACGAVLCGDDIGHPPVADAVRAALGKFEKSGPIWWRVH